MQGIRDEVVSDVISHSGWGCGLDVTWVFPKSLRVSYLEWWFANNSADYTFDPGNPWWDYTSEKCLNLRHRNLSLALELSEADHIVVPTRWQCAQLPTSLAQRCVVIHEGVDTDFCDESCLASQRPSSSYLRNPRYGADAWISQFVEALPHVFDLFLI